MVYFVTEPRRQLCEWRLWLISIVTCSNFPKFKMNDQTRVLLTQRKNELLSFVIVLAATKTISLQDQSELDTATKSIYG